MCDEIHATLFQKSRLHLLFLYIPFVSSVTHAMFYVDFRHGRVDDM